jgi:hypothetical protein
MVTRGPTHVMALMLETRPRQMSPDMMLPPVMPKI